MEASRTWLDDPAPGRAERLIEQMPVGFILWDREWRCTGVNPEGERLCGLTAAQLDGRVLWDVFPEVVDTEFEEVYRRVAETGATENLEIFYPDPLNRWLDIHVTGDEAGVAAYFFDVTERRAVQDLLHLSIAFGGQLVGAASVADAVTTLATAVVPHLADWAIVSLSDPGGGFSDELSLHSDPRLQPVLERYTATRFDEGGTALVTRAAESGEPIIVASGAAEVALSMVGSARARDAVRALATESVAHVPLTADSRVTGVLTLGRGPERPPVGEEELATVVNMGRRAGMTIDNLRLHAEQARTAEHDRTVARALQEALLTELPDPPGLALAARYVPAAHLDQVGGDWYDALAHPDGSVTVTIGDVIGHDIRAAAVMGQLRNILRTLAWAGTASPAELVTRLDQAVRDMRIDTMATLLSAQLATDDGEGSGRTVTWSNAGHPPPILLLPDGRTEVLDSGALQRDPPIGVLAGVTRRDHARTLPPGSTLLLYTDGLVETRDQEVHHGIDRLRGHLERHHGEPLDALLDGLLSDMVGEHGDDDIAMLAVRSLAVDAAAHGEVVLELPPTAEAAAVARAVVFEHGSFLPEHLRQDTELLVSELVANAIRHGRPPITLHVRPHPPGILVAVRDEGPQLPVLPSAPPGPDQPTGRGLLIIAALAGAWGVVAADGVVGKTVWIDLGAE